MAPFHVDEIAIFYKNLPRRSAGLPQEPIDTANELQETAEILLVETRGEGLLDQKGVASATGKKKYKHAITEAKKTITHDGEKEKVRDEFAGAETEEEDEMDDDETRAKLFHWRKQIWGKKEKLSEEKAMTEAEEVEE